MLLLPLGLGLAGCASLQENMDASRKEFYIPGKEIHVTDMKGEYRFCEVGLITGTSKANAIANIWNTTDASDPTPEQFAALDPNKSPRNTTRGRPGSIRSVTGRSMSSGATKPESSGSSARSKAPGWGS